MAAKQSIVIKNFEDKIEEIIRTRQLAGIVVNENRSADAIDEYSLLKSDRQISTGIYYIALDTIGKEYELYESDIDRLVTLDIIDSNLKKEDPEDLLQSLTRLKEIYPAIYQNSPANFDRIALTSNPAEVYYDRGNTKFDLGQKEAATIDYNKAIELAPNEAWVAEIQKVLCLLQ
jgi:tetratricopeptide (TPR) repeat protein